MRKIQIAHTRDIRDKENEVQIRVGEVSANVARKLDIHILKNKAGLLHFTP